MGDTLNRLRERFAPSGRTRAERTGPTDKSGAVRSAMVEVFERREIAGWVAADPGISALRVELCVNDEPVAKTWAAPGTGRRVDGELLKFRFGITDLWKFTKRADRVSVRVDGAPLPIVKKGTFYHPRQDGAESLKVLGKRLASGYVFGQSGRLQLSKTLDTEWQAAVLGLYQRLNAVLESEFGVQAFLYYGTLLGAVRDNGFIGHDLDFDCAYVSTKRTGQEAAEELGAIAFELMDRGFNVVPKRTCVAVTDELSNGHDVDIFHLYQDETGRLQFPFGIAGDPESGDSGFHGVRASELAGYDVLVPTNAQRIVELTYGGNWRTPNPGFRWQNDRTVSARDGIVGIAQVDECGRANIAPTQEEQREALRATLSANDQLPEVVVEIGSSLGDDTIEFARAGKRVIGLERSALSVARAERRVESHGLGDQVEFRTVEINDAQQVAAAIEKIRQETDGASLVFCARAFLKFSDHALRAALASLDGCGRPGDHLIADFRLAPANRWPKDKSPEAKPPWTSTDLLEELASRSEWSVVEAGRFAAEDNGKPEGRAGVIVARRG